MTADLERSHAELRAALMLAGKQIVKLNFGRKDDPGLPILRRVLRDARAAAKRQYYDKGSACSKGKVVPPTVVSES
jgi:hypothetical protein